MTVLKFENKPTIRKELQLMLEILPLMQQYKDEIFVIYCDDAILSNPKRLAVFASEIDFLIKLETSVMIVHGGDKLIDPFLEKFGVDTKYIQEVRVIPAQNIELVEMFMSGLINKSIVNALAQVGVSAIGVSGKDCNLLKARKLRSASRKPNSNISAIIDFGSIGEPISINPESLLAFEDIDIIPVISPVASDDAGNTLYTNPLALATILASSVSAAKLILISEQPGLMNENGVVIQSMDQDKLAVWERKNRNSPASHLASAALTALSNGVESVHIIADNIDNGMLLEVFTEQSIGTCLTSYLNEDTD